jgi:hypothetical protein
MSKACWIGITLEDLRYSEVEGIRFVEILDTGAYLEMESGQRLQRIVSDGRALGIGHVVLHNTAGIEVHEQQLKPIVDDVRDDLNANGVLGTVGAHVEHVDLPEKVIMH